MKEAPHQNPDASEKFVKLMGALGLLHAKRCAWPQCKTHQCAGCAARKRSSSACAGGPRRPLALLMKVAQKGVYIVVNAHKDGGIQPERSTERANEHGNQRWLTGEGRSWSHPVVRSQ